MGFFSSLLYGQDCNGFRRNHARLLSRAIYFEFADRYRILKFTDINHFFQALSFFSYPKHRGLLKRIKIPI